LIETTLWIALFKSSGKTEIAGFGENYYLAYVLWAAFIGRITSTWMYEFRMIEEIELGTVNSLLARPVSFFEYYISQFMGYKVVTSAISLLFPLAAGAFFALPMNYARLPATLCLLLYYLLFVHTLSFCIACLAFRLNKVSSFTIAKNLGLWLFSGELFPLDMMPHPWRDLFLALPFSNSVYVPVAYLTGRGGNDLLLTGFSSASFGLLAVGLTAWWLWHRGLRVYSGTGA
jgi:ABC-2 type transport system permease protein